MEGIVLSKQQAKEIAQPIYRDIKGYCLGNYERYFPWYLNEVRKEKGQPPIEPIMEITTYHRCDASERPNGCDGFCPTCDYWGDCHIKSWMSVNEPRKTFEKRERQCA